MSVHKRGDHQKLVEFFKLKNHYRTDAAKEKKEKKLNNDHAHNQRYCDISISPPFITAVLPIYKQTSESTFR